MFPDLVTLAEPPPGLEAPTEAEVLAWEDLDDVLAEFHHAELGLDETRRLVARLRDVARDLRLG